MQTNPDHDFHIDRAALSAVCVDFGITWLAVFGSTARGVATSESDVDILVKFGPARKPVTYFDMVDIADSLSPIFAGRRVDLGRPEQLHWTIRDEVLSEAKVLHAA